MATRTNNRLATGNTQQLQSMSVAQQLLNDFKQLWGDFITKLSVFPVDIEKIIRSFDISPISRAKSPAIKPVKVQSAYNESHIQQLIHGLFDLLENQKITIKNFLSDFSQTFKLNSQDHKTDIKIIDIVKSQSQIQQLQSQQIEIEAQKKSINIKQVNTPGKSIAATDGGLLNITPKDSPVKQTQSMIQQSYSHEDSPDKLYQTQMHRMRSETTFEDLIETCVFCKQQISGVGLLLNCQHSMHEQCFTYLIQSQIAQGQMQMLCICKQKMTSGTIRKLISDERKRQQILEGLCSLQLQELQRLYAQKISGYVYWTKESVDQGLSARNKIQSNQLTGYQQSLSFQPTAVQPRIPTNQVPQQTQSTLHPRPGPQNTNLIRR